MILLPRRAASWSVWACTPPHQSISVSASPRHLSRLVSIKPPT
jgi:hypothetical protein